MYQTSLVECKGYLTKLETLIKGFCICPTLRINMLPISATVPNFHIEQNSEIGASILKRSCMDELLM